MKENVYKFGHVYLIVFALILFGAFTALAVDTWHGTNQVTVAWDTSTLSDGTPLPAGESIKYYVYTKNEDGSGILVVGTTNLLEYTITVAEGSRVIPGVAAARIVADGTETDQSAVSWADDPAAVADGATFGLTNYKKASAPKGLRKK
jgi:hypothetical protein